MPALEGALRLDLPIVSEAIHQKSNVSNGIAFGRQVETDPRCVNAQQWVVQIAAAEELGRTKAHQNL